MTATMFTNPDFQTTSFRLACDDFTRTVVVKRRGASLRVEVTEMWHDGLNYYADRSFRAAETAVKFVQLWCSDAAILRD